MNKLLFEDLFLFSKTSKFYTDLISMSWCLISSWGTELGFLPNKKSAAFQVKTCTFGQFCHFCFFMCIRELSLAGYITNIDEGSIRVLLNHMHEYLMYVIKMCARYFAFKYLCQYLLFQLYFGNGLYVY